MDAEPTWALHTKQVTFQLNTWKRNPSQQIPASISLLSLTPFHRQKSVLQVFPLPLSKLSHSPLEKITKASYFVYFSFSTPRPPSHSPWVQEVTTYRRKVKPLPHPQPVPLPPGFRPRVTKMGSSVLLKWFETYPLFPPPTCPINSCILCPVMSLERDTWRHNPLRVRCQSRSIQSVSRALASDLQQVPAPIVQKRV